MQPDVRGFLVLTCLVSWPLWVLSGVLPRSGAGPYDVHWLIAQVGVFGPALAALIVSVARGGDLRRNSLRLAPVVLAPLVIPGILIAQSSPPRPDEFPLTAAMAAVVVGAGVVLFLWPLYRQPLGDTGGSAPVNPSVRWVLLSVVAPPALFLLAWLPARIDGTGFAVAALGGGTPQSVWTVVVLFAHNLLLGGALGEEIGWRGYLLPRLLKQMNPVTASVVVGVVWGVWHAPVDIYAGGGISPAGVLAVLARIVYAIPLSVLFTWFYLRSRGSLLVAVILHASINVMGDLGLSNFNATVIGFFVITGAAAWALAMFSPVFRAGDTGV